MTVMSQPNRILALPLHLANQIAAGEVIERPASVLKELIENSLDAGAKQIHINIEGAGNQLIKVRDDGHGIHPNDLALALSRHATSKLHSSEQLNQIASLGFRGEALPSIASISQLTLSSRQASSEHAWQISGENDSITPITHPAGTSVEVRELFFNVPARRRFLRGHKTELHHISTTIQRLALSHFNVGFQCQLSSSSTLKLPSAITPDQQQKRIAKICGKAFINNSIYLEQQYDDIELEGWIANTDGHRPQTDTQFFFINGRVIRDRVINHAIRQAYNDFIPAGRYPAFVLYLSMPLDRVDINVHPTKHEVRFHDARLIHGLITKAIQETLTHSPVQPSTVATHHNEAKHSQTRHPEIGEAPASYSSPSREKLSSPSFNGAANNVLFQRYLITQTENKTWLIDLQQAELNQRKQHFQQALKNNTLSSRPILVPIQISLEPEKMKTIHQNQKILAEFGFQFIFSQDSITIKAIPSLFSNADLTPLINNIASDINHGMTRDELGQLLKKHLPIAQINNPEQAQIILNQLSSEDLNSPWCQELREDTFHKLLSA